MIFTETYSEVGRATGQHLQNLRRQLGVGIDPAYDYTPMTKLQDKLTAKKERKSGNDVVSGNVALDQLRKVLKDASNPAGANEEKEVHHQHDISVSPSLTANAKAGSKPSPSWSFRTTTRDYVNSQSVENRWRAPAVGTYTPKSEVLDYRVRDVNFGMRDVTKNRLTAQIEKEIEACKERGESYEHLLPKPCTSVELLDNKPERVQPRRKVWSFARDLERPDLSKSSGIVYHDNTFENLSADLNSSKFMRMPVHEFGKTVLAEKVPDNFFQPGQYKINLDVSRPTPKHCLSFEQQPKRKPLISTKTPGQHLPDRSLARSCPVLSTHKPVHSPVFRHYTNRPPINPPVKPYHDVTNPEIDKAVMHHHMTDDIMESTKASWTKRDAVEKFEDSLDRQEHFRIQRRYGENVFLAQAKENTWRGPVSVELLSEIGNSPSLQPRVVTTDFGLMPEREGNLKKHVDHPPRMKEEPGMSFTRPTRIGDGRCEASVLSPTAAAISARRSARTFQALDEGEGSP